ncbi:hypothetical protein L6R53_19565 [Myxococcota bacterium]|nr:hypothetical protein [Myxococcota bacterium]
MSPFLLLVLGCASGIRTLYETERDAALARAPAPSEGWQPDVRMRISSQALDGLVQATLDQGLWSWDEQLTLSGPLGLQARVEPSGRVHRLRLAASRACDGCLEVDAGLEGTARWSAAGASGSVPFTAQVQGTVSFEVEREGAGWAVSGRLRDVDRVELGVSRLGSLDATELLGDWVSEALKEARPLALGTFGGGELPVAAARLSTPRGQLELQLLTDVVDGGPVSAGVNLAQDFEVRISSASALALARRKAFETGAIAYDVAAVPTSLAVDDDGFSMGLRLWKLSGVGWWRDYAVTGTMGVQQRQLVLQATEAVEGEKSAGAGLADPLALLAEGRILDAVADGLDQAVPASTGLSIGGQALTAQVQAVRGARAAIELTGSLVTQQADGAGDGRTLER